MSSKYENAIKSGPSKFDLMLALFDFNKSYGQISFKVADHDNSRIRCSVSAIRREGSDEQWIITGGTTQHNSKNFVGKSFSARYSTKTREGIITIES